MSDEKPTSIWKKEISFRRKPGEETVEPSSGTSIWKKEISLRKKARESEAEEAHAEAAEPIEAPEPTPVDLDAAIASLAVPAPEPVAPEQVVPEEILPEQVVPAPTASAVEHEWLTKPLEEISEPPAEPVTLVPALPTPLPTPPPEPVPLAAVPEPLAPAAFVPAAPAPVELELDLPTSLPLVDTAEAAWPTAPDAVAAPEPVVEPAPAAEPKVPFYKKELSFKRGAKAPKPPEERKAPKAKREKKEKQAQEQSAADGTARVPFYKRDLSFRRPAKQWDPAEATEETAPQKAERARPSRPSVSLPSFSRGGGAGAKRIVGLKIGGSQIAAARVHNGDELELVQAARVELEHGIVVNGELRDPEALAVALKDFFAKHKLPKRGVRLGIANNRIGVRTFEVTGIDDAKQLANAIRFRAQEVLPIPLEEAVLDYQVLGEATTEDGQPVRRVLLVVAYRELVDRYVYACRKAGLQIVGIDLEAFALLRAVTPPYDPAAASERGALVAVSVGHERSTFAVSDGRVCEFTRVLEWGGWALNVAIARALDMSPSEVEPLKRALSFAGGETPPQGFDEDQLTTAREAARRQLQTFARELVSSLQFYQNQPGSLGIGEIALTGGTAHLPGLGAELERLIGVPVRVVDPLNRLKVSKKAREHAQVGSLAVAIGLGIED